jgi:hypothetical protein
VRAAELVTPDSRGDPTLGFSWNKETGNDGDVLRLTIKRLSNGTIGGTQIRIHSFEGAAGSGPEHIWMGFVAN